MLEIAIADRRIVRSRDLARGGAAGLLPCAVACLVLCLPTRSLWLIALGFLLVLGALLFILYHRTEAKALTRYRDQLRRKRVVREVLRA